MKCNELNSQLYEVSLVLNKTDIIGNGTIRLSPKLVTSLFSAESSDADHSDLGESKLLGSGTKTDVEGNAIKEDFRHAFILAGLQRDIFWGI